MATLKEFRDERLRKLQELYALGVNPYPAKAERTCGNVAIHDNFIKLEGQTVTVVGRIISIRKFGKIVFIVIKDDSAKVQLVWRYNETATADRPNSELLIADIALLDAGDFIQATGEVFETQTGEESVGIISLRLLTKSLRPMPLQREGFTNKEERLRRRYVDTNVNQDVYQRYIRRSNFWRATRDFLNNEGFIEINIPVLENTAGGADANPFVTHMDALDQDFYLRISHELPLKRLLVAGYEKVFDIGPRFRNENYSDEHLPEHVAMEWYWAYADWEKGMELTERLVRTIVDRTWDTRQFKLLNGQEVDLGADEAHWPRVSFIDVIQEHYGLDVFTCTLEQVQEQLNKHNVEVEKSDNRARGLDKLWKKIRATIAGPAFLVDIPTFLQPLAKTQPDKPELTEQFNLLLGGSELCKAYSELNDPIDQLNRFMEQQAMRDAGDDEAQMLDIDYVEALEYAMPPACGFGLSERLFWVLEGVTAREGVPFPQLRRETDTVTKSIYPELFKQLDTKKTSGVRASTDVSDMDGSNAATINLSEKVSFIVDKGVIQAFPDTAVGYLVARIPENVAPLNSDVIAAAIAHLDLKGINSDNLTAQPEIAAWRAAFQTFGVKPSKYLSSAEALAKRALKGNPPRVNSIVDAYNAVSISNLIPMGAMNLDAVKGDIHLRFGKSGETADLLGMEELVAVEERHVVYADDTQIITWLWSHRDAKATVVKESSENVVFFADSLLGAELAEKAIAQLSESLRGLCVEIISQGVVSPTL